VRSPFSAADEMVKMRKILFSIASTALRQAGGFQARNTHRVNASAAATATAAAVGLVGGATSLVSVPQPQPLAMCSNDDDRNAHSAALSSSVPTKQAVKNIDIPQNPPEHNPELPFPEASLQLDTYRGVTLDISNLPPNSYEDAATFDAHLTKALQIWAEEEKRGIWIRIPTAQSHLIPAITSHGFDFQHAAPGEAVLTKWLPKHTESRLPHGPTHQVGIGALVLHPRTGKMLVVQERTGPAAARKLWKMPTGLTDPGEDVSEAAIRELKEETGLDCVFDRIVCFRQAHGGLFNRSDMFFVCLCKLAPKYEMALQEGKDVELLPQEEEILCADWIDMEDYAVQGVWRESPLYKEMNGAMLKAARHGIEYSGGIAPNGEKNEIKDENCEEDDAAHGFVAKNLPVGFRPGSNTIYVSSRL